mgnify:CR=1 FL=1
MTDATVHLRAELRDDSDVVATATPRLTWQVSDAPDGWRQRSPLSRCHPSPAPVAQYEN